MEVHLRGLGYSEAHIVAALCVRSRVNNQAGSDSTHHYCNIDSNHGVLECLSQ